MKYNLWWKFTDVIDPFMYRRHLRVPLASETMPEDLGHEGSVPAGPHNFH